MSEMDDLTDLLLEKTIDGKISWSLENEDRVFTRQGKNVIEVSAESDSANISIRNQDGIIITYENFGFLAPSYDKISEIVRKAKRSAFKVDEAIFDISKRLKAL